MADSSFGKVHGGKIKWMEKDQLILYLNLLNVMLLLSSGRKDNGVKINLMAKGMYLCLMFWRKNGKKCILGGLSIISSLGQEFIILMEWNIKGSFKMIVFMVKGGFRNLSTTFMLAILRMGVLLERECKEEEIRLLSMTKTIILRHLWSQKINKIMCNSIDR